MVAPISQLAYMEMALYGGFGTNMNAPSYMNNYMGGYYNYNAPTNYYNYGDIWGATASNYNPTFGQSIPSGYANQTAQQQEAAFQGLSAADKQALIEDYKKSLTPSEGFFACAATNAAFGLAMNPRIIAHPINTFRATFSAEHATNKFFNTLMKDNKFKALWQNPENSNILREAWLQHNKAVARCEGKLGAFRRSFNKTGIDELGKACSEVHLIKAEREALEAALKSGNMEAITKQTARLQQAYSVNGGFINRGWNKIKGLFTDVKQTTVKSALEDTAAIEKRIQELAKTSGTLDDAGKLVAKAKATSKTGFMNMLKRGGGVKGGLFFMGIELLMGLGKIKTAFQKDNETGMKQLGQTVVKGAGNAAGWALGEAAALAAFTKWGASIGTAFGPGVGTLIGGAIGLVGGGLGMWLAGKITKGLVGQDVADDIEAKKLASTKEGQVQLLQNTMQRIQSGEKVAANAQQTVQKFIA